MKALWAIVKRYKGFMNDFIISDLTITYLKPFVPTVVACYTLFKRIDIPKTIIPPLNPVLEALIEKRRALF